MKKLILVFALLSLINLSSCSKSDNFDVSAVVSGAVGGVAND